MAGTEQESKNLLPGTAPLAELNELLAAADAEDDHRRIGNRSQTVGHDGQLERASRRRR